MGYSEHAVKITETSPKWQENMFAHIPEGWLYLFLKAKQKSIHLPCVAVAADISETLRKFNYFAGRLERNVFLWDLGEWTIAIKVQKQV